MDNLKPYSYGYKYEITPEFLRVCFITQVPAQKNIVLRSGYPATNGSITTIIYDVVVDLNEPDLRKVEKEHEIDWDGRDHEVNIRIGSGEGSSGGSNTVNSNEMETL